MILLRTATASRLSYNIGRTILATLVVIGLQSCTQSRQAVLESLAPAFVPEAPPVYRFDDGIRVATLNGEFLFDGIDDEGEATFPHKGNPQLARAHRDQIAEIIRMIDVDVLMLVEVENLNTLQLLISESLSDLNYAAYLVDGTDIFTGQDVGILSRIPVDEVERTDLLARGSADADLQGVSKNIIARLDLAGMPTTIIGVHFLARPSDPERLTRRQGQAEVIRQVVAAERAKGRQVIVTGDLNDFDDVTADRNDNRPITDVLKRIKSAGDGPEDDLHNVIGDVPQAQRFTSLWDRNQNQRAELDELSAIDHMLVSDGLYKKIREVRFVHSHDPLAVTDHFPIVVSFSTGTAIQSN